MKSAEITQEVKDSIIRFYNNYYTLEKIKNIIPVNNVQYYEIINEAREKGFITIPKHSPKPKPPKPPKVLKQNLYDVKRMKEPEIYNAIVYYYKQGYRYDDIVKAVGVNRSRVKYYLGIAFYKHEAEPQYYGKQSRTAIKWTTAETEKIKEMFYNGYNINKIANTMGVRRETMSKLIKKLGLTRPNPSKIIESRILYFYRTGLTYKQIAEKMDISVSYVVQKLGDQKDRTHPHLTENELSTIYSMYLEGYTINDIAVHFGVTYNTIYQRLVKSHLIQPRATKTNKLSTDI